MSDEEIIFADDEMRMVRIERGWEAETVLGMRGMFWLKDVIPLLECSRVEVSNHYYAIKEQGQAPYKVMGVRKSFAHFQVRMVTFAPYYRKHLKALVRTVNGAWDAKTMLKEQGWFFLTDVCRMIPFTPSHLRYLVKKEPNTREQCGMWKDPNTNRWLVDMKVFASWIKTLWRARIVNEQNRDAIPIGELKEYAYQFSTFESSTLYTDIQTGNKLAVTRYGDDATSQQRQEGFRVALYLEARYLPEDADGLVEGSKAWYGTRWITAGRLFLGENNRRMNGSHS